MRHIRLILVALFLAPLGSLLWGSDSARVEVQVDGLSCPFCAFGMEKRIRQLEGLENFEILVDEGKVLLTFHAAQRVDFEAVRDGVRKGGFTPKNIQATLSGTLARVEGRLLLRFDGLHNGLLLDPGPAFERLESTVQEGDHVTVAGEVRGQHPKGHGEHPYAITVREFKLVAKPSS